LRLSWPVLVAEFCLQQQTDHFCIRNLIEPVIVETDGANGL
jgi:hypothetical protein